MWRILMVFCNQILNMMDIVYIGVMVIFFVVSGLYVLACDKM